jgi:titin
MDQPKVDEITKESVTLSWHKPSDDGGSKIVSYIIEKKSNDGNDWEEILEVPAKENHVVLKDVKENEQCQFRIKARNAVGDGEPSGSTDLITIEDQPRECFFWMI